MKKIILTSLLLSISFSVFAADFSDALIGFGTGAASGMAEIARRNAQQAAYEEQMRLNAQLEAERERRNYEYQRQLRQQAFEFERQKAEIEAARQRADQERYEKDRFTEFDRQRQIQIIEIRHPDWKNVTASKEYWAWKETLPINTRKFLEDSNDGSYIAEAITAFKEYQEKHKKTKIKKVKS